MADERTNWKCDKCGASGHVTYAKDAGVYEVLEAIKVDHVASSPDCPFDAAKVVVTLVDLPFAAPAAKGADGR